MTFKTEQQFEETLIHMLVTQKGWSGGILKRPTEQDLLDNWATLLFRMNNEKDRLNGVPLSTEEMKQLTQQVNLLNTPLLKNEFINGGSVAIKRENPDDALHFNKEISLKLFDKKEIAGGDSNYQIAQQPLFAGKNKIKGNNRGDFMLLINGMPVIHVELKRSGMPISHGVNQIQRYIGNGVFSTGIYSLVQVFAVMTPDDMRYFANPGIGVNAQINPNYVFQWGDFNNELVGSWKEIADTFLSIPLAHQLIGYYTVPDKADDVLKVLRSYQINAVKEIVDRIQQIKWHEKSQLGGYIWHTTGSGKTLTSFKAAELIASYGLAGKVVFVLDRIELGTQTLDEFRSFADNADDVQDTKHTDTLYNKLRSNKRSDTLIVTSIQKLSAITEESYGSSSLNIIKNKRMTIILDEAHRSTFGEMLLTIKNTFPDAIFFGFTGTPIHEENSKKDSTTATVFGKELHRYSLSDGIRDKNVLGFDVTQVSTIDYDNLRQQVALSKAKTTSVTDALNDDAKRAVYNNYMDSKKLPMLGYWDEKTDKYVKGLESDFLTTTYFKKDEHRRKVVEDIYDNWAHLSQGNRFSALLTTSSREEAIEYYRLLKQNMVGIKVTTLFDSNLDESDNSVFIENGLAEIIEDYNSMFNQSFTIPTHKAFKKDLANRLARKKSHKQISRDDVIHLVIVVNQLLTGFDSKWINTLYVDKKMEYADIIQAFSRTNRLNGDTKPFGSIRYYRFIYTMGNNIKKAVEAYSGGRPVALFVDKLGGNLRSMNHITEDLHSVFSVENIQNFERLPKDNETRKMFVQLFGDFNEHLEAAFIQGFSWDQETYLTRITPEQPEEEITVIFTKAMYDAWLLRYKELESGGGGGGDNEAPFDINYELVKKSSSRIDYDYLNSHFQKYISSQTQGDANEQERIKNDLHRFFATLTAEQQAYANMVINDLENGDLVVEAGKEFTDYINEYQERSESRHVTKLVDATGVDIALLNEMTSLNINEKNIDEFGRFTKLKKTANKQKAKDYFEHALGKKMKVFEVSRMTHSLLQDFIMEDGFDVDEYLKK